MADLRTVIAEAIEEWASTAFHPGAVKPNDPTLARYIEAKIRSLSAAAWPGAAAQHSVITPTCRTNRGDAGAFEEAVERARSEYDAVVEGWRDWHPQPTIHLVLTVDRPARQGPTDG